MPRSPAILAGLQAFCFLSAAVVPAALTAWTHPKAPVWSWVAPEVPEVTLESVAAWKAPYLWLDARRANAYESGHIGGALLLNGDDWDGLVPKMLAAWRPGMRLVVYCDSPSCDASQAVALRLRRELRLPDVYVLHGGWAAWQKEKGPPR